MTPRARIYIRADAEDALLGFPLYRDQWLDYEQFEPDQHCWTVCVLGEPLSSGQESWLNSNPAVIKFTTDEHLTLI